MPTGYTDAVMTGHITTLEEFAWNCARAFFYDDSMPASLEKKPSDYHLKELRAAEQKLKQAKAMTLKEARSRVMLAVERVRTEAQKALKEADLKKRRYQNMLTKVREWHPPTKDHQNLKNFMVEQLETSLSFDCDSSYWADMLKELEADIEAPQVYRQNQISKAREDVEYHAKQWAEDCARANRATSWLQALDRSLPRPKKGTRK